VLPQIGMAHHMANCVRGGMNWGFQAFLATYKSSSCGLPHSGSSIPIRNQGKRPSLKGVTSYWSTGVAKVQGVPEVGGKYLNGGRLAGVK
jgi:hypothetical protein